MAATQSATGERRVRYAYMAPELFEHPTMSQTVKCDVYSFGIFLWELLSGGMLLSGGIYAHVTRLQKLGLLHNST